MERKYYLRGLGLGIAVTAVIMGILTSRDRTMTDKEIIARAKELGMVENTVLSDMNEEEEQESEVTPGKQETESGQAKIDKENDSDSLSDVSSSGTTLKDRRTEDTEEGSRQSDAADQPQGGSEGSDRADKSQSESENPDSADQSPDDTSKPGAGAPQGGPEESDNADRLQTGAQGSTSSVTVKTITISPGDGSHTVARKLAEAGIVSSADTFDEFLCQNGYDKKLRTGTFSIPIDADDEQIARIVTGAE